MSTQSFDFARLTKTQITQRLEQADLPEQERDALVEELSNRVTQELLEEQGEREQPEPVTGTSSGEPLTPAHPTSVPPLRQGHASTRQSARPVAPIPRQVPRQNDRPTASPASRPSERTRTARGLSRFAASLLALLLTAGVAWVVLSALDSTQISEGGGSSGETAGGDISDGVVGTARVDWSIHGVPYSAIVATQGLTGTAEVSYPDPMTGQLITVQEDLSLEQSNNEWHYTGSNPRDPVTGGSVSDYAPDVFWLTESSDGMWFYKVCDTLDLCGDATTTPI